MNFSILFQKQITENLKLIFRKGIKKLMINIQVFLYYIFFLLPFLLIYIFINVYIYICIHIYIYIYIYIYMSYNDYCIFYHWYIHFLYTFLFDSSTFLM
jgi:hypothetical protein